jgi:hypothetical protein
MNLSPTEKLSRPRAQAPRIGRGRRWFVPLGVLLALTLGCSAADLVQRSRPTPTPEPTATLVPTFTPTAVAVLTLVIVTPPSAGQPGVIIVPPGTDPDTVLPIVPTDTPTVPPEATPTPIVVQPIDQPPAATPGQPEPGLTPGTPGGEPIVVPTPTLQALTEPTATPAETATATPAATATPYILVMSGLVALRTGPGLDYPLLAQLGPSIPVAIIGRNEDGSWLEICCISGQVAWVVATHVTVVNDAGGVQVSLAAPPPPPTPTPIPSPTPTETVTPTPTFYPFERAIGPQFFPTENQYLTLWGKLYVGVSPYEDPAPGYYLKVLFEGFERPNSAGNIASADVFEFSAPPGSGSRVLYNYKYEYRPPDPASVGGNTTSLQLLGTGTWTVYVADGLGTQLSEAVTFTTAPSNPNREVYIGWIRVR